MESYSIKNWGLFLLIIGLIAGVSTIISGIVSNFTVPAPDRAYEMFFGTLWGVLVLLVSAIPGYAYFRIGQMKQEANKLITTGLWLKLISIFGFVIGVVITYFAVLIINPSDSGIVFTYIFFMIAFPALALYGLGLLLLIIGKIRQ
jgi:hypothetical protein